ncbi:MAG TPA: cation transporter [Terriglobia bacterium]|nr:cation transporter [Terriglobia bacterium]
MRSILNRSRQITRKLTATARRSAGSICQWPYPGVREHRDLNLRSVFVHYLGDALSNVGIIAGAILIRYTGQSLIDSLLAFLIAGMIFWGAFLRTLQEAIECR